MKSSTTLSFFSTILFATQLQAQQTTLDPPPRQQLAHDIFQQLIEINTTDSVGSTTLAAEAMRQAISRRRLRPADVVILGPNNRKGNLVARLHGSGRAKPDFLSSAT